MKKYLSIALIALAILSACSEEELLQEETTTPIAITFDDGITISESPMTRGIDASGIYYAFSVERAYDSTNGERYLQYGEALFFNPNAKDLMLRVTRGVKYRLRCLVIQNHKDVVYNAGGNVSLPFSSQYYTLNSPVVAITNQFCYSQTKTIFPSANINLITIGDGVNKSYARVLRYQGEVVFTGGEPIELILTRYTAAVNVYIAAPEEGTIEVSNQSGTLDIHHSVCAGQPNYVSRDIYSLAPNSTQTRISLLLEHTHADGSRSVITRDNIEIFNGKMYDIYINLNSGSTEERRDTTSHNTDINSYGYPVKVTIDNSAYDGETLVITK